MIIFSQAVLDFAKELADQDLENVTAEDRQVFVDLAEQLEQLSFEAGKLKIRVKQSA
jgi:hypothetical protein